MENLYNKEVYKTSLNPKKFRDMLRARFVMAKMAADSNEKVEVRQHISERTDGSGKIVVQTPCFNTALTKIPYEVFAEVLSSADRLTINTSLSGQPKIMLTFYGVIGNYTKEEVALNDFIKEKLANDFGKGLEIKIDGAFGTIFGDEFCFDENDDFYQYFITAGELFKCYYNVKDESGNKWKDLSNVDFCNPDRIEEANTYDDGTYD